MKRLAVLGAGLILLGGCALPVPVQIASWALDGISYLMTDKSVTDQGISVLARKDCAVLRGLLDPGVYCREFDDNATVLADGMSYDNLFSDDQILSSEVDALAEFETAAGLAEFETAGGGDTTVLETTDTMIDRAGHMSEMGVLTNARANIEDGVEEAASLVSAAMILKAVSPWMSSRNRSSSTPEPLGKFCRANRRCSAMLRTLAPIALSLWPRHGRPGRRRLWKPGWSRRSGIIS